jgi:hypothetical protein
MRLMLRGFRRIGQPWSQARLSGSVWGAQLRQSRARPRSKATTMPLGVGHPGQALEQADRAAEAAEQVAREGELQREDRRADDQKARLVGGERAVQQIAPDGGRRQQVGQQRDRPQKAEAIRHEQPNSGHQRRGAAPGRRGHPACPTG